MLFNRPEGYTELELLEEIAGGNESAFNLLYDKYAGKVYAMGIKYLKSPFLAQDAVQEIFVKVWNNRGELPYVKNFPAWLSTISRNQLINELQKQVPMEVLEESHPGARHEIVPVAGSEIDFRELEQLIKKGVESLSPRQQQIYKLSREDGLNHKKIAVQLSISYDVVREHMSKALKNLRIFLENNYRYMLLLWLFFRHP